MLLPINARHAVLGLVKKNGVGAEIGVHEGEFSASILKIASPKRLHLIDPWKHFVDDDHAKSLYGRDNSSEDAMESRYNRVLKRFSKQIEAGSVNVLRETSEQAAKQIEDESLDFVYVDGDHNYQAVLTDAKSYWPKLAEGGLMIFDDYRLGGWWGDGVVRSVHEWLCQEKSILVFAMDSQVAVRKLQ